MRSIELVLLILGLSVICVGIAAAGLFFLPAPYAQLAVTFTGSVWTPVVSAMLIIWFNREIKEGQTKSDIQLEATQQDLLEVKTFVDGNYSKLLTQLEHLRDDNQQQRDLIAIHAKHEAVGAAVDSMLPSDDHPRAAT